MACGQSHDPFAGNKDGGIEIGLLAEISKGFAKLHRGCKDQGKRCWACLELGHEVEDHVKLKVHSAEAWPGCGDDGRSSTAIWQHMRGGLSRGDHPHDPADFARCSRLLAAPWALGWRARMPEMSRYGAIWAAMAARWEEMEALFVEEFPTGNAPKLYAMMRKMRGEE